MRTSIWHTSKNDGAKVYDLTPEVVAQLANRIAPGVKFQIVVDANGTAEIRVTGPFGPRKSRFELRPAKA